MASLFKARTTRYVDANGKAVRRGTAGAKKVTGKTEKWYGQYRAADGTLKRVALCKDKTAAQSLLNEYVRGAEREQAGMVDPFEAHRKRPLTEHLADYRKYLEGKNTSPKHVRQVLSRLACLFKGCRFGRINDLSTTRVVEWLAERREAGKLRTKTFNDYHVHCKAFGRWMVRNQRMASNPFAHLSSLNAEMDIRRERRALSADEFSHLLAATATATHAKCLSGRDREMIYLVAANTGLRANELASLTAASFDLDGDPPTVTVEAGYSKHRRRDVLPLRSALVSRLRM